MYLNLCVKISIGLRMHAGFRWVYTGMSVSDLECQLPMGYVGLRWVSDQACRSPMKHVEVSNGSPIRHYSVRWGMSVTDRACPTLMGLRSGMSFSDVACRGLRWVSNQACRSTMKHIEVFDGCMLVSDVACRGI